MYITGKLYFSPSNKAKFDAINKGNLLSTPEGGWARKYSKEESKKNLTPTEQEKNLNESDPEAAKESYITRLRNWVNDPEVKDNASFLANSAKYLVFLGIAGMVLMSLKQLFDRMNEEANSVNNEIFKITELKRSSMTFTGSKICSGDRIYNFGGFQNVQKESINSTEEFRTKGGETKITDHTFESVSITETITPPSNSELTFRVKTTFIRRMICLAVDIVVEAANTAKDIASGVSSGIFGDINWGIVFIVIIALVVGGVALAITLR